ncbi:MAG: hypothetical protein ACK4X1_00345 [Terricaulis sp.]
MINKQEIAPPPVGTIFVEAGTKATRWRLREIWRDVCVLDSLADKNRTRYLYLSDLRRTSRYADEADLRDDESDTGGREP